MKKISIICFLAFIAVISVISCSKDIKTVTPQNITPQNVVVENNSLLSLNELTEKVSNFNSEYASFENEDEFYNFLTSFDNLEEEEKSELLTKLPYQTLEKYLDDSYTGMDKIETEEEFEAFIAERSDYFSIKKMENGEKEVIELGESLHSAFALLNPHRIVKVGEEYSLFLDDARAYSEDYEQLKAVQKSEDLLASRFRLETVVENVDVVQKAGWNEPLKAELSNGESKCRKQRKIKYRMEAFKQNFNSGIQQGFRYSRVEAKKRNSLCIWYKFKTTITWNNFRLEHFLGSNFDVWTVGNTIETNVKQIERKELIADNLSGPIPPFLWTRAVTKTTHAEMDGLFLEFDLNL
jgi:hypothetical protein